MSNGKGTWETLDVTADRETLELQQMWQQQQPQQEQSGRVSMCMLPRTFIIRIVYKCRRKAVEFHHARRGTLLLLRTRKPLNLTRSRRLLLLLLLIIENYHRWEERERESWEPGQKERKNYPICCDVRWTLKEEEEEEEEEEEAAHNGRRRHSC